MAWADQALADAKRGGTPQWAQQAMPLIKANMYRIKALHASGIGDHTKAIEHAIAGLDELPRFGSGLFKSDMQLALAALQLRAGQIDQAEESTKKVLIESDPYYQTQSQRLMGDIALARGKPQDALVFYTKATEIANARKAAGLLTGAMSSLGKTRAERALGKNDEAVMTLRTVMASLESIRVAFSSGELRMALSGGMQDIYDEAVDFFAARGEWEAAFNASESSRARAMLDLQSKVDGEVISKATRPKTLTQIQAGLGTGATVVSYHQLPKDLIAVVIGKDSIRGVRLLLDSNKTLALTNDYRKAIEAESDQTVTKAKALYNQLISPLQLPEKNELIFIPHKALHMLPIQALHTGKGWLIESNPVITALSASLIGSNQSAAPLLGLAALGNPELGRVDWALPGSEREVKAIAPLYEGAKVFVKADATKAKFLEIAPGATVVHIAAHAVVDDIDPMHSAIKLTKMALINSDLEAHELSKVNLSNTKMVVLSACNSGTGRVAKGDEFMGFKRSILAAGAASALLSLWPVDDESTEMLMTGFHTKWKTMSRAKALQEAQLQLIKDDKFKPPFYWAPFVMVVNAV